MEKKELSPKDADFWKSDKRIQNLPAKDNRQELRVVGDVPHLYLFVHPSGTKSWVLRYRWNAREIKKIHLGNYPTLKLSDARQKAQPYNAMLEGKDKNDPLEAIREERLKAEAKAAKQRNFRDTVEEYLQAHAVTRRTFHERASLLGLRQDADGKWQALDGGPAKRWGNRRLHEVSFDDIRDYTRGLAKRTPFAANRKFEALRAFFNWCVGERYLTTASPMVGMKPPTSKEIEKAHQRNRTLLHAASVKGSTDDELRWLWKACEVYDLPEPGEGKEGHGKKYRGPFGPLVQLLILTGQRRNEVGRMTWNELDLDKGVWVIPGERAKNGNPHLVPLSEPAVEILRSIPKIGTAGYVFTTSGETPVSGWSRMKKRLDKLMTKIASEERGEPVSIPEWRLHDIRRTVAHGLQRLGTELAVTERVLNHLSGSFGGIVGVYQVHEYATEKRAALDKWARFVTTLVSDSQAENVIPLRQEA